MQVFRIEQRIYEYIILWQPIDIFSLHGALLFCLMYTYMLLSSNWYLRSFSSHRESVYIPVLLLPICIPMNILHILIHAAQILQIITQIPTESYNPLQELIRKPMGICNRVELGLDYYILMVMLGQVIICLFVSHGHLQLVIARNVINPNVVTLGESRMPSSRKESKILKLFILYQKCYVISSFVYNFLTSDVRRLKLSYCHLGFLTLITISKSRSLGREFP